MDQAAVEQLLSEAEAGSLRIATSTAAWVELRQIPPEFRAPHSNVDYNLERLRASTAWLEDASTFKGAAAECYARLREVLPDEMDARHLTHATMHRSDAFITTDSRTILRFRDEIARISGLEIHTPSGYRQMFATMST